MKRHALPWIVALGALGTLAACNRGAPPAAAEDPALAAKQAELQQREAELAAREAELAAREAAPAATPSPAPAAAPKPVVQAPKPPAPKPAASSSADAGAAKPVASTSKPAPAAPTRITVPTGTLLSLSLDSALTSKTAKVGDPVRARVTSDVNVDGRVAIPAGATVAGSVIQVVSGSDRIGGVPTLGISFDRLELAGGRDVPIAGEITQSGKSDTGRDTAKIVGGAAAGAILGHQVKGGDKGKVIGGLLGGAIGAVAAKKTGTEVTMAEGTAMTLALAAPVEVTKP